MTATSWTIAYQGKSLRVRGSRGFVYLAALLGQPGERLPASELAGLEGDPGVRRLSPGELRASGLRATDASEAGERRAASVQEEIDFILQELAAAVGRGGRARKAGPAAERARLNVTRAIRSAIERIGAHHRPLARYLSTTISTGMTCAYETEFREPIPWVLR